MYKKLLITSLALCIGFASCKQDTPSSKRLPSPDSPELRGLKITGTAPSSTFYQLDTAHLSVSGVAKEAAAEAVWSVNGKEVAKGATYDFIPSFPGSSEVTLTVWTKSVKQTYTVAPRFTSGTFLLNEGNFGNETGTLTYISPDKSVVLDHAYYRVNGTKLGNVCQDLAFANDKVYIISQNGPLHGGEGLLTIAEAGSLKKVKVYNDATLEKQNPTHIAVIRDHIYLRTQEKAPSAQREGGIYYGTENGNFMLIPKTEGVMKLRMAQIGERIFALTSDGRVLMIQGKQVVGQLSLAPAALSGISVSHDGKLWVATTQPDEILKVDPDPRNFVVLERHTLDKSIAATNSGSLSWQSTSSSAFFAHGEKIYFTGYSSTIYCHDFAANKTTEVTDITKIDGVGTSAKMYYNSLGVSPVTGELFYAALEDYGTYKTKNVTLALKPDGTPLLLKQGVNSFPAGFYFIPTAMSSTATHH